MRSIIAMPFKMVKGRAVRCSDLTNAVMFAQRPQLSTLAPHRYPSEGIVAPLYAVEHSC
jgi:hypothetical protein